MDLRSLINKLDAIEQAKLLLESEELMERVGLRLQDIEQAAGRELDDTKRAAIIGDFARKFGYAGLFDPNTGKFVNKDGRFASFGAYQSEVEQLEDEGLIPNSAKTSALLGFLGKDEKASKPTAFARADLFGAIDKADGLLDKALAESVTMSSNVLEGKSIASALLAEFGLNTTILEAITPEEHQFLKKTVKDAESIKHKADAIALITRYNKEYIPARDRLIAEIKKIIAAMAPAAAPAARAPGQSASESVSSNYKKPIFELKATKPGITIHQPNFLGYLSPEKAKHNADMLRTGKAELEPSDHVGQNVADLANGLTFGFADKAAAYLDSVATGTKYDDQLAKYKGGTDAYNKDKNALNVRNAAGALGYEIDKDNMLGNITPGDLLSLFGGAGLIRAGAKGAAKVGGGKVAQTAAGLGTGVVAPVAAALTIGNPEEAKKAAKGMDSNTIKAMQADLVKAKANLGKFGPDKNGVDGKLGKLTLAAMADPKYSDIVQKYIKPSSAPAAAAPAAAVPAEAPAAAAAAPASAEAPAAVAAPAAAPIRRSDGSNGAYPASATVASAPELDSFVQDPSITPQVVKAALAKVGVTGNSITPEQLLALATSLGISEVAESTELDRIRKLSGLSERTDLNEGPRDKFASWVLDTMIGAGGRKAEQATIANLDAIGPRAAEIAAAKKVAREIQARGAPGTAAVPSAPAAAAVPSAPAGAVAALDPVADAAKQMAGKSAAELRALANNPSLTALQRKAANAELQRIGGAVDNAAGAADNAAGAVDNAAGAVDNAAGAGSRVAGAVDNAAGAVDNVAAAAGKSLLYKTTYALGKLGGRFTRLVKNNKFLSLLAALTALGIAVYLLGKDDPDTPPGPVQPQPVVPVNGKCPEGYKLSKDGKTCEKDTGPTPTPVVDPKEEERKRQLAELEKLLARLNDGWPTDPETAETIKAAVAIGAKAPAGAGASTGAVNTQPAAPAADRIGARTGVNMSAIGR